MNFKTR